MTHHFLLHTSLIAQSSSSTFSTLSCSFKPHKIPIITNNPKTIPATDRVIDFGKYKGKMLGTLPSNYLKWVSKNLRAQDFEHWAMLADQVLQDPVYKDRIEWEFAENVLTGNSNDVNKNKNMATNESSVSRLLELSQRFGWDNEDRVGWSKLNFELLGTSKGGRIPRISERKVAKETLKVQKKERFGGLLLSESEERRRERRMRVKEKVSGVKIGNGNGDGNGGVGSSLRSEKRDQDLTVEIHNPFPGREALLKKVMSRKRFL
ncbi:hypothetical protein CISIN_1g024816mg [Citrus sinensis]|uniref:Uncharacterized protein n=1 Tax=Citrus sinensis TaxID=2711 RepID=A0A067DNW8_CITSI|nr:hypothetical protein CISIN_1g024816mg [Citrus sinensis]